MTNIPASYKFSRLDSKEAILQLDPDIIRELDIKAGKQVQLKFGNLVTPVNILQLNPKQQPNEVKMKISGKVLEELHIPIEMKLSLRQSGENQLSLGPVIGIITFANTYAKKHFNFYLNYRVMLKSGLLYVFSGQAVNPKSNTVKGYYFNPAAKTWALADLPYPDAVIDRCYPNAYWTHGQLERYIGTGKIFNKKTMINKLDFFRAISEDNILKEHLPETRFCCHASDFAYLLKKYGKVFIKPVAGMQGRGIVTAFLNDNGIKCRYMAKGQITEKELSNPRQIFNLLATFGYPRRRYIIQEAVSLLDYQGKPFTFRVMVCKNGQGQWLVPAIFTNAATGDSFLTNHAAGTSKFIPFANLFKDIEHKLKTSKADFINSLVQLGISAARVLDKKYGPLGELGLDMVADRAGKPRFLEANGNPGMVPMSHMVDFPKWRYQAFELPISYAIHLAGYENY